MKSKIISFEEMKEKILYHRIVEWNDNEIVLDDGLRVRVEETDYDCCASAYGKFKDVKLDAAITDITQPKYFPWENEDTYGCSAIVKFLHNRNAVCVAEADADAGNGGYYYSVASFVLTWDGEEAYCKFVHSGDSE